MCIIKTSSIVNILENTQNMHEVVSSCHFPDTYMHNIKTTYIQSDISIYAAQLGHAVYMHGECTSETEEGKHSERVNTEEGKVWRDAHC